MKSLVTIVVPVYNVEKYLDRCIESIVNQTYRNLEIILVDDGSPDRCPQMCDAWAEKDSRIKVIHKENEGQGIARNAGIDQAKGAYICFFDSDDYIANTAIEQAYDTAQEMHAELVIFGMASVDKKGNVYNTSIPSLPSLIYEGAVVQEDLLPAMIGPDPRTGASTGLLLSACSMMISMDLIQRANWRFVSEREIISEDGYSLIALCRYVRKAVLLPAVLYYYCDNDTSFSRGYRADRYQKNKFFYIKCLELCKACGYSEEVFHRCSEPFLRNTIAAMKQEAAYHDRKTAIKHLHEIIDDSLLRQVLNNKRNDKTGPKKQLLFWAVRNRYYYLCYVLLMTKNAAKR